MGNLDKDKLKFKKKMFNGIDELDALNKIKNLNNEYKILLKYREVEYVQIIQDKNAKIEQLEKENELLRNKLGVIRKLILKKGNC